MTEQMSLIVEGQREPDHRDRDLLAFLQRSGARPVLSDTIAAADAWGANCGPMSLAAVLGLSRVEDVRDFVQPFRGFMSPTDMDAALTKSGRRFVVGNPQFWPESGLVRIQWNGPWCDRGVPAKAAYRYTHWVGVRSAGPDKVEIYDATPNCWVPLERWSAWCPSLWPKRAMGWYPRTRLDVL